MNFLRKRLFVAYGMLLVLLAGFPGMWVGQKLFPARSAKDPIDAGVFSQSTSTLVVAHVALLAFVIYLHTRRRDARIIEQAPRSWLTFTYGAYAIGFVVGVVLSGLVMR